MSNVPLSIEGVPLTELIGKEVEVNYISEKKPTHLKALNDSERKSGSQKAEILWDVEYMSSIGDYRLLIIIAYQPRIFDDNSRYNPYRYENMVYECNLSDVKLTQVKDGRILNLDTPEWHEKLLFCRKYTKAIQDGFDAIEDYELEF